MILAKTACDSTEVTRFRKAMLRKSNMWVRHWNFRWVLVCLFIFSVRALVSAQVEATRSAPGPEVQPCGTFSDYLVHVGPANQSSTLSTPKLPVSFMFSRSRDLRRVSEGYSRTGLPMVAYDGTSFLPAGPSDDLGLYYIVPWISRTFHLSVDRTITGILFSGLGLGFLVGSAGLIVGLRTAGGKAAAVIALLLLALLARRVGDVYIFEFAALAGLVPWILYFTRKKNSTGKALAAFLFLLGLVTGICGLIRFGSAPGVLTVAIILLLFGLPATIRKKAGLIAVLLLGFVLPQLYLGGFNHRADVFLTDNAPGYHAGDSRHVFWHFAYLGLGFLSNPYVPGGVCDEIAKDKVAAIAPGAHYCSVEYDTVLRHEVLAIAKQHPNLVLFTVFAKLGIVLGIIIVFANVGLLAGFLYRKPWPVELAFWSALVVSAGPLVILAPLPMYSLGIMTLSVVYGVVSLDHAFAARNVQTPRQGPPSSYPDPIPVLVDLAR
jgi:hypothetical protein